MFAILLSLAGCDLGETSCTTEAVVSVAATAVDEAGNPATDAELTYDAGDGEQPCDEASGEWHCGYEVAGDVTVYARALGYLDASETVTVGAGECHVETETVELVMQALDCTTVEVPAVTVQVLFLDDPFGAQPSVTWRSADQAETACESIGDDLFGCAWERSGELTVTATADAFETWEQTVTVDHDGCHPITQEITAELVFD